MGQAQKRLISLPLTLHWLEASLMDAFDCLGYWDMQSLSVLHYVGRRAQIWNDGGDDSWLSLPQMGYSFQLPARVSNSLLYYCAFI